MAAGQTGMGHEPSIRRSIKGNYMAKIKFGDYLKSRQTQAKNYESDEALVRRARSKMAVDEMVVSPAFRVQNLEAAADLLAQAQEWPGADRLHEECLSKLREAKKAKKEADYQRALLHLSEAKEEHEFDKAAGEFANLAGYKDADEKKNEAKSRARALNRRFQIVRAAVIMVIALIAVLAVYGARHGYLSYAAARLEGLGGQYNSAYNRFLKLGDLADSKAQAEKYHELYLRQRETAEEKALPDAKKGDTVSYAGQDWLVLRRAKKKLLLICTSPDKDSVFYNVQYHDVRTDVTWEDSSLRAFLNGGALEGEFTELERAALVPMTYTPSGNDYYGVSSSSGELTDLVRIFDLEDLKTYGDVFTKPGADMWLAAPGHDASSAAYMSKSGTLMLYGDDVTDMNLSACPVITVDLTRLS